jgi:hypothetical protein
MSIAERAAWEVLGDEDSSAAEDWHPRTYRKFRYGTARSAAYVVLDTPADLEPVRARRIAFRLFAPTSDPGHARATQALEATIRDIRNLAHPSGVDDEDTQRPTLDTITHAYLWILKLFAVATHSPAGWTKPHVAANPAGEIVFHWFHRHRTLTVYITAESAEYVESWGTNIRTEMTDGDAESEAICRALWARLTGL